MFEINATFVIFIASFLVFMVLLNKIMLEPVGKVLEAREAKIKADLEAGKDARKKAEQVLNEYQSHLHSVRSQAQGLINEAIEKATYHRNLEVSKVRAEGDKKVQEAKAAIAGERDSAVAELVRQEQELVESITHKLLGEKVSVSLDADKVRRALEEAY